MFFSIREIEILIDLVENKLDDMYVVDIDAQREARLLKSSLKTLTGLQDALITRRASLDRAGL